MPSTSKGGGYLESSGSGGQGQDKGVTISGYGRDIQLTNDEWMALYNGLQENRAGFSQGHALRAMEKLRTLAPTTAGT